MDIVKWQGDIFSNIWTKYLNLGILFFNPVRIIPPIKFNEKNLILTEGEILRIIVIRSGRKAPDAAALLGLNDPTYLSKLYSKKKMPEYVIQNACASFGYEQSVFDSRSPDELNERLASLEGRVNILEKENDHLQTKTALLSARLEDCEREKNVLKAKQN